MCNINLGSTQALPAPVAGDVCDRNAECAASKIMATEDSPPPKLLYPEWQKKYEAALLELDREKLSEQIAAAEAAIYERLQKISGKSNHQTERQAIEDALSGLRVLKRDNLGFPDWESK
jgi:hypothetical protein